MPSTHRPGWDYEKIIVALLRRVGGYVSFPAYEAERGRASFHLTEREDGSLHLWLPSRKPEGEEDSPPTDRRST